jgi:hypothetical protein
VKGLDDDDALIPLFSPDDGHIVARNMQRIEINIQRMNCAPGWFYSQDYTRVLHGQQNIKKQACHFAMNSGLISILLFKESWL